MQVYQLKQRTIGLTVLCMFCRSNDCFRKSRELQNELHSVTELQSGFKAQQTHPQMRNTALT